MHAFPRYSAILLALAFSIPALAQDVEDVDIAVDFHGRIMAGMASRLIDAIEPYYPMFVEEPVLPDKVEVIREKPAEILKTEDGPAVVTAAGKYPADGVFVLREAVAPAQLVPGLETDGAHVKVNRKMETNLPGVFACGDLTGTPYQYVKAAGEGNVAAISAAAYLDRKNKEEKQNG